MNFKSFVGRIKSKNGGCCPPKVKPRLFQLMRFRGCRLQNWMTGLQLPSEDDIRKYMLENITEEQFKAMMEEEK